MSKPNTPSKTITIKVDNNDRELFMSYGLLNELLRLIPDTNLIALVYTDPDIRNKIIEQVLADRSPTGKITTMRPFDMYIVEQEAVEEMLEWVVEHVTAFFIRVIAVLTKKVETPSLTEQTPSTQPSDGSKG